MSVTLQRILEDLNYLLGDTSVPSTGIDNQKRFINNIDEKIYDYHDWNWGKPTTTYTMSGTTQALESDFVELIEVRERIAGSENDNIYKIVDEDMKDTSTDEYICWTTGNEVDGYTLNINQTDNPTLEVKYQIKHVDMTTTASTTKCPRSMPIARGALALMQEAEDPYRDTTDAWAKFQRELDDLVRFDVRTKPAKKFYDKYEANNQHMGEPK